MPLVKQKLKNSSPAFLAMLSLFVVEMIRLLGLVSQKQPDRWYNFEILSNFIMLAIALAGFFCLGIPSKKNDLRLVIALSNISVSVIAILMNIYVFEHTIQWERLFTDILIHIPWISCIVVQLLFLTGFGSVSFQQAYGFLKSVKGTIVYINNIFTDIAKVIKDNSKIAFLTIFGNLLLWIIYLVFQIRSRDLASVLSDEAFWQESMLMWFTVMIMGIAAYLVFLTFQQIKDTFQSGGGKKILIALIVLFFAVTVKLLPSLLQTIAVIIFVPIVVMGAIWLTLLIIKKYNPPKKDGKESGNTAIKDVNLRDVPVVLVSFVVLPLTFIGLVTLLGDDAGQAIAEEPTDFTAWLNFISAAAEAAKNLLELII